MTIDTAFLRRCIATLEAGLGGVARHRGTDDISYDMCRAACVKDFELVLEQCGKLLRKRLAAYFASNRQADRLAFKDLFRHAARHGLLDVEEVERWFRYRDNRNDVADDDSEDFAEATLQMLPTFIDDAKALTVAIEVMSHG